MRNTMLPPWLRAESHAHRQLNTLPRCMRPEGDGAKRPTTGAGTEAGCAVGASAAGVAMLRALISMRTSIARGRDGEASRWFASCRGLALRMAGRGLGALIPVHQLGTFDDRTPGSSSQLPGGSAEKGDMILKRTAKGQTVFAQLLYAPRLVAQSTYAAPTQSRYTCDGAVKWYLLLARDSAQERLKRQICCCLSIQPNDPFSSVPNRSFSKCRGAGVTFIPFGTPVA